MPKTVIILAPAASWRNAIVLLLQQQQPKLHVFPVDSSKALEARFRTKLFPQVLCALLTGAGTEDMILHNLVEEYLYQRKTRFVFIMPFPATETNEPLAYETNFQGYRLMPLSPAQVAGEIIQNLA